MDISLNDAVESAMREAARMAILPRFFPGSGIAADWKAPDEAVTAADRDSEAILRDRLRSIHGDIEVVGEEAAHSNPEILRNLSGKECWIVDPLDGTGNFARGEGPFGLLVALARDGVPVGGWILDPLSGRFCAAQAGCGALINGERSRINGNPSDRPRVAVTTLVHDSEVRKRLCQALATDFLLVDAPRCAAELYPSVALGAIDGAIFTRTLCWDHAAGICFLQEMGGRAERPDASPYRCDTADGGLIACGRPALWGCLAEAIANTGISLTGAGPSSL